MATPSSQTEKSTFPDQGWHRSILSLGINRASLSNLREKVVGDRLEGVFAMPWEKAQNQGFQYQESGDSAVPMGHSKFGTGLLFYLPPSPDVPGWLGSISTSSIWRPPLWTWITWLSSVLAVSSLLSFGKLLFLPISHSPNSLQQPASDAPAPMPLARRSECGSGGIDKSDYDMPLHVGALFVILFVSAAAAGFPILATRVPGLKIPSWVFFTMRHFGTGVIIGAAFIHLLPPAFVYLSDPCLGDFWVKDYPAISGVITMSSVFLVVVLEMLLHPARKAPRAQARQLAARQVSVEEEAQLGCGCTSNARVVPADEAGISQQKQPCHMSQELTRLDTDRHEASVPGNETAQSPLKDQSEMGMHGVRPTEAMTPEQKHRWEILQCLLLELGILVHSVFIGMTLSVSIGNNFIVLLIAIIFHQLFEGLALGSRIADISWRDGAIQPWLMALAYGCTTPIGQAIGLATHTLYSPDSKVGLLVVGILSAISAGLLTFASLVELLAPDFLTDKSWNILYGKARVYACLLVFFGAFLMSLVGAWA